MKKQISFFFAFVFLCSCSKLPFDNPKVKKSPLISWTKNFDPHYDSGNLPIGTHGPLIYKDMLFVGSQEKTMNAYDLENGSLLWSKEESFGPSAKPALFDDKWLIYGSEGGRVYSRNYLTGKIHYKIDLGSAIEATPVFHKGRGIFHLRNHKIVVMDASTGKVLWSYKRSIPFTTTLHGASAASFEGDSIFIGFADGSVVCFNINDGQIKWEQKVAQKFKFIDIDIKPYIKDNFVYVGPKNGALNVLNKSDGSIIKTLNYMVSRAPVEHNNFTIWGTTNGDIVVLGKYDKEIKKIHLEDSTITGLKIWKDNLLVGTSSGHFYMLSSDDYSLRYKKHFGSVATSLFSEIETEQDHFALLSSRNRLYVFKNYF